MRRAGKGTGRRHALIVLGATIMLLAACAPTPQDQSGGGPSEAKPAAPSDFATEDLGPVMSVKVVDSLDEASDHIALFGSQQFDASEKSFAQILKNDRSPFREGARFQLRGKGMPSLRGGKGDVG